MLMDWFADMRAYFSERLRNPVLAPFTVGWVVTNWRLVSVLLFSNKTIEERIAYIDENYLEITKLLFIPLVFALSFALLIPWLAFVVQLVQERANLLRKKHKLKTDAEYLRASVEKAEAQAALNRILAEDAITKELENQLGELTKQLAEQDGRAQATIAAAEDELERKRREYEERSDMNSEAANMQREEIEQLRQRLEQERERAKLETEKAQKELSAKQKDLELRLRESFKNALASADGNFESLLFSQPFRIYHNPAIGPERSKVLTFESAGQIGQGRNKNEHSWQVKDGKLELLQADKRVHSRFHYLPDSQIFVHTGDADTKSARGQFIIPELQAE